MASYLPNAITAPIAHGSDILRSTLGSISFGPALTISKLAVTSMLSKIELGTLILKDEATGETTVFGQRLAKEHKTMTNGVGGHKKAGRIQKVELVVRKETFWVRLFLFADMGFAEAYMLGEVECADLTGFFQVSFVEVNVELISDFWEAFYSEPVPAWECYNSDLFHFSNNHWAGTQYQYALELAP
jgi:cyclopropane-fatty-acyl-phospholipid synthase